MSNKYHYYDHKNKKWYHGTMQEKELALLKFQLYLAKKFIQTYKEVVRDFVGSKNES